MRGEEDVSPLWSCSPLGVRENLNTREGSDDHPSAALPWCQGSDIVRCWTRLYYEKCPCIVMCWCAVSAHSSISMCQGSTTSSHLRMLILLRVDSSRHR